MSKVIFICGSLRKGSYNRIYMERMMKEVPASWEIEEVSFKELPIYDFDIEGENEPDAVTQFRNKIAEADGVIIVSPEYNSGIPGGLKNAIDWASRVKHKGDKSPLIQKPFAIAGCSPGAIGTALMQAQLRQSLTLMNAHIMPGPKLIVGKVQEIITEDQSIEDEKVVERMIKFLNSFDQYVNMFKAAQNN